MQGIVLTQCDDLTATLDALGAAGLDLLKIVTGWGYPWDAAAIGHVCASVPRVIVRTVSGDGCRPPANGSGRILLDPGAVLAEIDPWLAARPDLLLELGNEPNMYDPSDDAAYAFAASFHDTLGAIRGAYPSALILSPGLAAAPDRRPEDWMAIGQDDFELADGIGFHAYAYHTFIPPDTGDLQRALGLLESYYPNHPWIGTELGINDPATPADVKAQRYAETWAALPSQVAGVTYYHYTDHPSDADQAAYNLPPSCWPLLGAS